MKKNILYLFAASLAFVSCSQDNDLNTTADNAEREIRFASSLDITTRANTADATTVQTNGFKAAAFNYTKSGATKTLGDAFVTNWAVAYSNNAWVPGETKLWPSIETNKGLDFLAYSTPQDISNKVSYSGGVMTIADFTPAATAADQKELLVAYTPDQTFENTKTTGVSLAFKHALSQIAIQVKNSKSKAVTISEVKVCNAAGKGTLKYGYEQALTWTQGTDKASYALSDLSVAVPVYAAATDITNVHTAGDYFMLVPQEGEVLDGEPSATSGAYFSITYKTAGATNSTTATVALPANAGSGNYEWEAGKKYLYTLELSDELTATLTSMEQINALWSDFGGGLSGQEQEEGAWQAAIPLGQRMLNLLANYSDAAFAELAAEEGLTAQEGTKYTDGVHEYPYIKCDKYGSEVYAINYFFEAGSGNPTTDEMKTLFNNIVAKSGGYEYTYNENPMSCFSYLGTTNYTSIADFKSAVANYTRETSDQIVYSAGYDFYYIEINARYYSNKWWTSINVCFGD